LGNANIPYNSRAADYEFLNSNTSAKMDRDDWLSFEFEPARVSRLTNSRISISNLPEYARAVPIHPDDGSRSLDPLPNKKLSMEYDTRVFDALALKIWLWDVVGAGIGYRADSFESDAKIEHFAPESRGADNNYKGPYTGAAYTMYQAFLRTDTENFRYFIEAKTPRFTLPGDDYFGFCFFGGYEPDIGTINAGLANGYYRYGKVQTLNRFDLGDFDIDRMYFGVEIGLGEKDSASNTAAITFAYVTHMMHEDITSVGREYGVKAEKPGDLFVIGACFRWK